MCLKMFTTALFISRLNQCFSDFDVLCIENFLEGRHSRSGAGLATLDFQQALR